MTSQEPEVRPLLCVAGTGLGTGKTTAIVGLMARAQALGGHPVGMKPIEIGCSYDEHHDLIGRDGVRLREARTGTLPPLVASPYRLAAAEANPAEAARVSGLELTLSDFQTAVATASEFGDVVFVELPGDALQPLAADGVGLDLAHALGARVLVVSPAQPDAIDPALALCEDVRRRGLVLAGVLSWGPDLGLEETLRTKAFGPQVFKTHRADSSFEDYLTDERVLERCFEPRS